MGTQMNTVWCPSLISWYHFYSILKQFCLSAIYLLILSTQVIAEYILGTAFSQRLSRTFLLWTFSVVCFQGEEVGSTRGTSIKAIFFFVPLLVLVGTFLSRKTVPFHFTRSIWYLHRCSLPFLADAASKPWVRKLQPGGQIQLTTCFCTALSS